MALSHTFVSRGHSYGKVQSIPAATHSAMGCTGDAGCGSKCIDSVAACSPQCCFDSCDGRGGMDASELLELLDGMSRFEPWAEAMKRLGRELLEMRGAG